MFKEPSHDLNELTKRLVAQGYTREKYPEWVSPYNWFYGGFTYERHKLYSLVFSTPCGLLIKGEHFSTGNMSFMGIDWSPENDNPVCRCPYDKAGCDMNHPVLSGHIQKMGLTYLCQCACRSVNALYDYEKSYDKAWDDRDAYKDKLKQDFIKDRNGFACSHHMYYHEKDHRWTMKYDPMECARWRCFGACDLTKKELSSKKGNVFYDVKTTYHRRDDNLFKGQRVVSIEKGKKMLSRPCSLTICQNIAKACKGKMLDREKSRRRRDLFFNPEMEIEVLNVRAEARESRDLLQDLQDVREGITVVHVSDFEKQKKADKSKRQLDAKEKKLAKLRQKILQVGFYNLDDLDKRRAEKWLGDEIYELEDMRNEKPKEEYIQQSLF